MATTKDILYVTDESRPEHNYQQLLAQAVANGLQLEPDKMYCCYVYHDDWCAIWQGGCCNCNPEICVSPI